MGCTYRAIEYRHSVALFSIFHQQERSLVDPGNDKIQQLSLK